MNEVKTARTRIDNRDEYPANSPGKLRNLRSNDNVESSNMRRKVFSSEINCRVAEVAFLFAAYAVIAYWFAERNGPSFPFLFKSVAFWFLLIIFAFLYSLPSPPSSAAILGLTFNARGY